MPITFLTASARRAFRSAKVRRCIAFGWTLVLVMLTAGTTFAQPRPRIDVTAPTAVSPALVSVRGVLADRAFDDLMRNGFPVRLHMRAELWRSGRPFDEIVAHTDWDVIVRFDTFDGTYEVRRITPDGIVALGAYKKLTDAQAASELPFAPPLAVSATGHRSYIAVQADVQTIEMSDLDELQRWLRGEARPAVQGRKSPGTALSRGFRAIVSRLLGAEVRHLEGVSRPFTL